MLLPLLCYIRFLVLCARPRFLCSMHQDFADYVLFLIPLLYYMFSVTLQYACTICWSVNASGRSKETILGLTCKKP